jgi:hypothetical protein
MEFTNLLKYTVKLSHNSTLPPSPSLPPPPSLLLPSLSFLKFVSCFELFKKNSDEKAQTGQSSPGQTEEQHNTCE